MRVNSIRSRKSIGRATAHVIVAAVVYLWLVASPAGAQLKGLPSSKDSIRAQLVASVDSISPGMVFRIGVLFTIEPRSHIYWRNPGDSGLATGIEWAMPEGYTVGAIHWPNPKQFEIEGIDDVNYGYKKEVLLYADVVASIDLLTSAEVAARSTVTIKADPYWLLCKDDGECIPGGASLSLELPVSGVTPSKEKEIFTRYEEQAPRLIDVKSEQVPLKKVTSSLDRLLLQAKEPWRFRTEDRVGSAFFPDAGPPWELQKEGSNGIVTFRTEKEREDTSFPGGVATLPMKHEKTGDHKTFYFRILGGHTKH